MKEIRLLSVVCRSALKSLHSQNNFLLIINLQYLICWSLHVGAYCHHYSSFVDTPSYEGTSGEGETIFPMLLACSFIVSKLHFQ